VVRHVQLDFLLVRIGRFALECEEERLLPNTHPSRDLHHPALLRLELQLVPDFYGGVRSHRLQRHPPRGLQNDTLLRARQGLSCRLLQFRICLDCDETGIFALLGGEKLRSRRSKNFTLPSGLFLLLHHHDLDFCPSHSQLYLDLFRTEGREGHPVYRKAFPRLKIRQQ
jgi:hypothetical protein